MENVPVTLAFKNAFKSIQSLPTTELPALTVITGVNGSGKSHLLEAVKAGAVTVGGIEKPDDPNVRLFNWSNLAPNHVGSADPIYGKRERKHFAQDISKAFEAARLEFIDRFQGLNVPSLPFDDVEAVLKVDPSVISRSQGLPRNLIPPDKLTQFQIIKTQLFSRCRDACRGNSYLHDLLVQRADDMGVAICSLSLGEIERLVPLNWSSMQMFEQNFSQIFSAYNHAWHENRFNQYANEHFGESNLVLSDEEFRNRFGEPPWDFVNSLLAEARLGFAINRPVGRGDFEFEARLTDTATQIEVLFADLSSGEKIIMSFALCLYNAYDTRSHVHYPKLLLFDEIDAPLHPSMAKDLLRVIEEVLVRRKGIKVILTTHSPATVAFAPPKSLYRLDKHPRALVHCSREEAIQILTNGYISVTESSRFVLTEAKQDRLVYTAICKKLVERGKLSASPNLVFVQASDTEDRNGGGCEQVKNWGSKLPNAGLNDVLGLIDRDTGNVSSATVKVLRRYSLENYLLDPVIVYAVLMKEGKHAEITDVGIKDGNFYDLQKAEESTLQQIADAICSLVEQHQPQVKVTEETMSVEYLHGKSITVPVWLRDFRGHHLEAAFRETFRAVVGNGFILTKNDCVDLTDMLSERLPDFIPSDLIQVLEELLAVTPSP